MKLILQLLLTYLTFLAGITIVSGLGPGSVVVNEVELNPSGEATEWVELYNSGEDSVNIGRWSVSIVEILPPSCPWTVSAPIPRETILQADEYYVWVGDPRWVHGNNGTVYLRTDAGVEVDRTPLLKDEEGSDFSWSRYPNGFDTDQRSDWAFIRSTPGRENTLRLVSGP
ncbi:lamin tail domain-containing protein [Methanocrinis sp.]|uniref:lamin tail domain-containing protein n=1 Tax=Methanocrinis sp. TaxID=3101522 RepID=UPI003D127264